MKNSLLFLLAALACEAALAQPDISQLEGIWYLERRPADPDFHLTDLGEELMSQYDVLTDDPSLQCVPSSLGRIYSNPRLQFEIVQQPGHIEFNYRLFDLRRTIYWVGSDLPNEPSVANIHGERFWPTGRSTARMDGNELIITTGDYAPGYLRTTNGLPQGTGTVSTERVFRDGDDLLIELAYYDPELYLQPHVTLYRFVPAEETELGTYDCMDSSYEWFEKLNQ